MLKIRASRQFRKDLKKALKQGKDGSKIGAVIGALGLQEPLAQKHVDHALTGNFKGFRECHIEPDWLLIYRVHEDMLDLTRTGSHSELFRK